MFLGLVAGRFLFHFLLVYGLILHVAVFDIDFLFVHRFFPFVESKHTNTVPKVVPTEN